MKRSEEPINTGDPIHDAAIALLTANGYQDRTPLWHALRLAIAQEYPSWKDSLKGLFGCNDMRRRRK